MLALLNSARTRSNSTVMSQVMGVAVWLLMLPLKGLSADTAALKALEAGRKCPCSNMVTPRLLRAKQTRLISIWAAVVGTVVVVVVVVVVIMVNGSKCVCFVVVVVVVVVVGYC